MDSKFVHYKNSVAALTGTKQIMFNATTLSVIENIRVCNITNANMQFNLLLVRENTTPKVEAYQIRKYHLNAYEDVAMDYFIYLEIGDNISGWAEFSDSAADVTFTYREILNQTTNNQKETINEQPRGRLKVEDPERESRN